MARALAAAGIALAAFIAGVSPGATMPSPEDQARMNMVHQARITADDVVVGVPLSVDHVPGEDDETALFTTCRLTLRVHRVERGTVHAPGGTVAALVPCWVPMTREETEVRQRRWLEAWRRLDRPWGSVRRRPEPYPHPISKVQGARFIRLYLNADGTVPFGQYDLFSTLPD